MARFLQRPILLCVAILWACANSPSASAQGRVDLSPIIAKVKPSVAQILTDNGTGSGFVVDARGIVATNYHVIEGAKTAKIVFPGSDDKKEYPVAGYLAISPGKDMALLYFKPEGRVLVPLPMATKLPNQGEPVVAFGAPLGLSDTVTDGIVSAVRSGEDIRKMVGNQYDADTTWIQTNTPISPGNSGGPLVNARSEVVGMNTFHFVKGQNLNFSVASVIIRDFVARSGTNVTPFANLPKPRTKSTGPMLGDPAKTMTAWIQLNKALNELNDGIVSAEKKLSQIDPPDPRNPIKGRTLRLKKKAKACESLAKSYRDYLTKLKSVDTRSLDPDLITVMMAESGLVQHMADTCHELSMSVNSQTNGESDLQEAKLSALKTVMSTLQGAREQLRVALCHKYNKQFPTAEETAKNGDAEPEEKKPEKKAPATEKDPADKKRDESASSDDDSGMRLWTSRDGSKEIRAKLLGVEDGKVRLKTRDGKVVSISIENLSKADRRYIGEE